MILPPPHYTERYLNERILAYYGYKNEIPVLSESAKSFTINESIYIKSIYNKNYDKNMNEIKFTETINEAYNKYLREGGHEISETELNKADFQKLLNKNYVLYGK